MPDLAVYAAGLDDADMQAVAGLTEAANIILA
jgi:hypothetical protein